MGTGDVSITEIRQPEELLAFIKENAISIVMTDKEAEMLLGYMEGHDYVVGFAEEGCIEEIWMMCQEKLSGMMIFPWMI